MLRRPVIVCCLSVVAVGAWAACVGDDPATSTTAGRGAQGQACYENNTCLVGLTCTNALCVVDDGGAASSTSGTSTTSSASSSSGSSSTSSSSSSTTSSGGLVDAGPECRSISSAPAVPCPITPTSDIECKGATPRCCPGLDCKANVGSCDYGFGSTRTAFSCFASAHCTSPPRCCMFSTSVVNGPTACGLSLELKINTPTAASVCGADCGGGTQLCDPAIANTCAIGTCRPATVTLADPNATKMLPRVVGVCVP